MIRYIWIINVLENHAYFTTLMLQFHNTYLNLHLWCDFKICYRMKAICRGLFSPKIIFDHRKEMGFNCLSLSTIAIEFKTSFTTFFLWFYYCPVQYCRANRGVYYFEIFLSFKTSFWSLEKNLFSKFKSKIHSSFLDNKILSIETQLVKAHDLRKVLWTVIIYHNHFKKPRGSIFQNGFLSPNYYVKYA